MSEFFVFISKFFVFMSGAFRFLLFQNNIFWKALDVNSKECIYTQDYFRILLLFSYF